jgi:hypothetical protein
MTAPQIIIILKQLQSGVFLDWEYAKKDPNYFNLTDELKQLGEVEEINPITEQNLSKEVSILHFVDHNIYIKVSGDVDSYGESTIFDTFEEVSPITKTVTFYE